MEIVTQLYHYMMATALSVRGELDAAAREGEPDAVGLLFLLRVCQSPSLPQDRLADQMGVDRSTATRRLTELERRGFVERVRNKEDRRQMLVRPTDKAFELLPYAIERLDDIQAALTRGMSREEIELLQELVARLAHNAARMRSAHDYNEA